MKMLLIGIVVLLMIALAGVLLAARSRPRTFRVQRAMTTSASADAIYTVISDLKRWPEWSPWNKYDPNIKMSYGGNPGEVGAWFAWEGNNQVGSGKNTIVAVKPGQQIEFRLEMYSPIAATNKVTWAIEDLGAERKFTWTMDGDHTSLMPRIMGLFMDMDKMVGGAFEEGLASLRTIVNLPKS